MFGLFGEIKPKLNSRAMPKPESSSLMNLSEVEFNTIFE